MALLLAVVLALPASAAWMVPGMPWRPKDFSLIKHDGLYHLFYIRHNLNLPDDSTEADLGHAVSADLWHWSQLPPVIPTRPGAWDRTHIWSPHVAEQDGVFFLFYTGVIGLPGSYSTYQRIGVATSTDLMQWNRVDLPVYSCPDVPWTVCDSLLPVTAFRDPFVMRDPAHPGSWLMYYSTYPASDSTGMVVGMASSGGDLTQWSDLGPLWITNRAYTYSAVVESPHLFSHAGLWYLFYTTNAGQPITFSTGPDPVGPVSSWTYRGRLSTMLGYDTQAWIASEQLRDGLVDYFGYAIADRIDIKRMVWGADWRFSLTQPDFMHVRKVGWSRTHAGHGDTLVLSVVAASWNGSFTVLEGLRLRSDGSQVPVDLARLGLPAYLPLTADTTRFTWVARCEPEPTDTSGTMKLLVRTRDQTAIAPLLTVDPAPPPEPPAEDAPPELEDRIRGGGILFRALPTAFPGAGRAMLVQLERSAPSRLDVFDLQGRRVRNLVDRELPAGATVVPWDGRDAGGAALMPGVYLVRLVTPGAQRTVRLVLVR